jgi:hypothetical protein
MCVVGFVFVRLKTKQAYHVLATCKRAPFTAAAKTSILLCVIFQHNSHG